MVKLVNHRDIAGSAAEEELCGKAAAWYSRATGLLPLMISFTSKLDIIVGYNIVYRAAMQEGAAGGGVVGVVVVVPCSET